MRKTAVIAVCLLLLSSCQKEDLGPAFSGTWTGPAIANHGFNAVAGDDHQLTGEVYITSAPNETVAIPFFGGRWDLSEDGKMLTLNFGSAENYGTRNYEVMSILDPYVVRLTLRQKENTYAPPIELTR